MRECGFGVSAGRGLRPGPRGRAPGAWRSIQGRDRGRGGAWGSVKKIRRNHFYRWVKMVMMGFLVSWEFTRIENKRK